MSRVRFLDVAFGYPDAPPLLSRVELDLAPGWTALVGPNGAGKTTLLRLAAGELAPTGGHLRLEPEDAVVAYCRQMPGEIPDEVSAFAWTWDAAACRLRARLGLDPEDLDRWATLSPGERQRWQIAAALDLDPDVLLLDEPTNHLDAGARAMLVGALREYGGVGLVVAHDRAFLDALISRTVWVDGGTVASHAGTYSEVRERMRAANQTLLEERQAKKREAARMARELDARRRRREAADAQISGRRRMKGPRDSDGRGVMRKGLAEKGAKAHARAVATMRARAERAQDGLAAVRVQRELGGDLFVDWAPPRKSRLLEAVLPELRAGERSLLEPTTVVIERDSRIHLAGPNGAGKTTLLRALLGHVGLPPADLLHLPQELDATEARALVHRARALPPDERGRLLQLVAVLGVEPDGLLASQAPSPGEARKLALAEGLARGAALVVLDEPTNHLDVATIERLERALSAYPGALLLVTHDDHLAAATTTERWTLADGRLLRATRDARAE